MRQWTTQERQRQAQLIKQWQTWQHSTGARTIEGKAMHYAMRLQSDLGSS